MKIEAADGAAGLPSVSLAGPWLYRVGVLAKGIELPSLPAALPPRPGEPDSPGALFPRLVEPLAPFGLRGVAWYQGEANVSRAAQYRTLFPALIADWRKAWKRPNLPFLFVQLAGCARKRATPGDDLWAELREAQALALRLPDTAMAVTLDLGHRATPPNKQEVSRRLALLARARLHGEPVPCSGPVYDAMAVEGDKIRARFKGAEGGLDVQGGDATRMLAIAGEDKRWLWADFKVEGETLVVWNRQVPKPVAVRYAWEHTPRFDVRPGEGWVTLGLLFNKAGLPAAPFRTDDWPGVGDERH
jgi:sialate O-acetylesterase